MEITETLDITPEELFDQIERSIMSDIEDATGSAVGRSKLNGFKYKKQARQKGAQGTEIGVKIKRYRYPEAYEVRFTYSTGSNLIKYQATPTGDGRTVLEYSETVTTPGRQRNLLGALGKRMYERKMRRRAEQTIAGIVRLAKMDREKLGSNPALDEFEAQQQAHRGE